MQSKYIYNVSIKIQFDIEEQWLAWMKNEHIPEVIATTLFDSYTFFELLEPIDEEGKTFVVQYFTDSALRYEKYIAEYAALLRAKGFEKFSNKFIAFRSIMKEVE